MNLHDFIEDTHFTWAEALKNGNNYAVPDEEQKANIIKQAHLLECVRILIGPMRITSWLRTPAHNRAIKGAPHSTHLAGAATDFIPVHMDVEEAKTIIQNSAIYPGGGELNSKGWVHLDFIHKGWFIA